MNLYDIVLRGDRMADAGGVEATVLKEPGGTLRAVRIAENGELRLRAAHEATALRTFPMQPGWRVHCPPGTRFEASLETRDGRLDLACVEVPALAPAPAPPRRGWRDALRRMPAPALPTPPPSSTEVRLVWPVPVPAEFDLCLRAQGGDVALSVGPLLDARIRLLPFLRGRGIEVGPGANPSVLADAGRTVTYVEKLPAEQWAATYAKRGLDPSRSGLWSQYVVDDAGRLDGFADGSLDFIFSSHVIEHLVNPLAVFENWWSKLASGGVIAGVVPDARFTFDLRQPLSTTGDLGEQFATSMREPSAAMYERWCRHTAIDSTPASLRERGYAIHVNYFSPDVFRAMLDMLAARCGAPAGLFMEAVANGKDFGFAVVKP